jgi:hypothetical protein
MKREGLLSISAFLLVLVTQPIMAADGASSPNSVANPHSTERDPGPPALTPAETRSKQERERRQSQQNNRIQNNGTQGSGSLGTVPMDNGGAASYPQTQLAPGTTSNDATGNGTTNSENPSGSVNPSGTTPTSPASGVPAAPVAPTANSPGIQ